MIADIPETDIQIYVRAAREIARAGAEVSSRYFNSALEVELKSDQSPVTIADRESESAMRSLIAQKFPDHQIVGEEYGCQGNSDSPWKWVIDPIDGTKSFIHRIPLYTVLVALMYRDQPLIGVIYNPQTDEIVSAATGSGCWYNGDSCRVSTVGDLSGARLQLTDPSDFMRRHPSAAGKIISSVKFTRTWADAQGYMLIATGRSELMIDPVMSLWDIACLYPIIREAGGMITDMKGSDDLGTSAVASNGILHGEVLSILQKSVFP